MSLVGTLQPPGTRLVASATVFDGPVTFTSGAPVTTQGTTTLQSLSGNGPVPTPAAVAAGAGTGSSVASFKGHDLGGSFVLTTAGTPAAGPVATITFGTPLPAAPVSVVVTATDTTGSPILTTTMSAGALATTGFSIVAGALTAAHTYLISYVVVAS